MTRLRTSSEARWRDRTVTASVRLSVARMIRSRKEPSRSLCIEETFADTPGKSSRNAGRHDAVKHEPNEDVGLEASDISDRIYEATVLSQSR